MLAQATSSTTLELDMRLACTRMQETSTCSRDSRGSRWGLHPSAPQSGFTISTKRPSRNPFTLSSRRLDGPSSKPWVHQAVPKWGHAPILHLQPQAERRARLSLAQRLGQSGRARHSASPAGWEGLCSLWWWSRLNLHDLSQWLHRLSNKMRSSDSAFIPKLSKKVPRFITINYTHIYF